MAELVHENRRVPLVAGEATPPVSRVAAAADFGNGVSWVLSRVDGWQFINPDLTVYLHAYPSGEWVCLDAVTWPQANGVGLAESGIGVAAVGGHVHLAAARQQRPAAHRLLR